MRTTIRQGSAQTEGHAVSAAQTRPVRVPPRWFVHVAWRVHRLLYRLSGGRFLWTPSNKRGWGALRLTTTGRRSGRARNVIVGYLEDGPNVFALAMNGWQEGHPAWWLNLQADPDAVIREARQKPRAVRAYIATGEEHDRLWQRFAHIEQNLDTHARRRTTETTVVVFEPRDGTM